MSENKDVKVTCRKCGKGPYTPSFIDDFYQDNVAGPGTGLCESCMMAEAFKPKEPVEIEKNHLKSVCKFGGGSSTCRFLVIAGDFKCTKGSGLHQTIEARAETMTAKGDNCGGPPDFKKI